MWVRCGRGCGGSVPSVKDMLLGRATWRAPTSLLWTRRGREAADAFALVPDYSPKTLRRDLLVRELRGAVVAVTPCSAPPAVAGTMSLTGQEKFETAPTDKRFPTTNQAKHCYM